MTCPLESVGRAFASYRRRALAALLGSEPSVVYQVSATPEPDPSSAVSVTATGPFWNAAGTLSFVVGAAVSTFAAADSLTVSTLPTLSTDAYRTCCPFARTGCVVGPYSLRFALVSDVGSLPSVVNHVCPTPEPAPSDAARVTVTSVAENVVGTLSVVTGAVVSTLAGAEVRIASTLPTLSTDAYLIVAPLASVGLLAASYSRRVAADRGSAPSVVYHVAATPGPPPPSPAVRVTAMSLAEKPVAATLSFVVGAAVSTFAAAEACGVSALPARSTE